MNRLHIIRGVLIIGIAISAAFLLHSYITSDVVSQFSQIQYPITRQKK